jgi:hypothetical protein
LGDSWEHDAYSKKGVVACVIVTLHNRRQSDAIKRGVQEANTTKLRSTIEIVVVWMQEWTQEYQYKILRLNNPQANDAFFTVLESFSIVY